MRTKPSILVQRVASELVLHVAPEEAKSEAYDWVRNGGSPREGVDVELDFAGVEAFVYFVVHLTDL